MQNRPVGEQIEHDLVVREAARGLGASGKYTVFENAGEEKNSSIRGHYPDIVGTVEGKARFVVEVETVSSVDVPETKQWKGFAGLGVPFYLMVPERYLPVAKRLCEIAKVDARFAVWHRDEQGRIRIGYNK